MIKSRDRRFHGSISYLLKRIDSMRNGASGGVYLSLRLYCVRKNDEGIDSMLRNLDDSLRNARLAREAEKSRGPKEPIALVTNPRAYGKFVALDNFLNHKLITYGKDASVVIERARRMGHGSPLVFYCPGKDDEGQIHY